MKYLDFIEKSQIERIITMAKSAKKTAKRGRKPGTKIGPYKLSLSEISAKLRELDTRVKKMEKVLG